MSTTRTEPDTLNAKQFRFCEEYLVDLNAAKAAERAGYAKSRAKQTGYELLNMPLVQATISRMIAERSARTAVTADRVVEELALIGFSDMRKFATWGPTGVTLNASQSLDAVSARCVAEVGQTTSANGGSLKFKLHDKVAALTKLGEHLGMFKQRVELSGSIGTPPSRLSELERDRMLRDFLAGREN